MYILGEYNLVSNFKCFVSMKINDLAECEDSVKTIA